MTEKRILVLEDSREDAELMLNILRESPLKFTEKVVDSERGFIEALEKFRPDLILADYRLPSFDGLSALRISRTVAPETPFVLVSGAMNQGLAYEGKKLGARGHVDKGRLDRLAKTVISALEHPKR